MLEYISLFLRKKTEIALRYNYDDVLAFTISNGIVIIGLIVLLLGYLLADGIRGVL